MRNYWFNFGVDFFQSTVSGACFVSKVAWLREQEAADLMVVDDNNNNLEAELRWRIDENSF